MEKENKDEDSIYYSFHEDKENEELPISPKGAQKVMAKSSQKSSVATGVLQMKKKPLLPAKGKFPSKIPVATNSKMRQHNVSVSSSFAEEFSPVARTRVVMGKLSTTISEARGILARAKKPTLPVKPRNQNTTKIPIAYNSNLKYWLFPRTVKECGNGALPRNQTFICDNANGSNIQSASIAIASTSNATANSNEEANSQQPTVSAPQSKKNNPKKNTKTVKSKPQQRDKKTNGRN